MITTVSLRVPESVGAPYVAALRRLVPELPPIPSGILLAKLRKSGLVVLGAFPHPRAEEIVAGGRAAGLTFTARERTLFDRALVLETVGAPPLEVCERPAIEAVFYPSFSDELVVRASRRELTAYTGSTSISGRLCSPEPWLDAPHDAPSRPPLECRTDRAAASLDPSLLPALRAAVLEEDEIGCDGVIVQLRSLERDGQMHELQTWSPSPDQPNRYAITSGLLHRADAALTDRMILGAVVAALAQLRLSEEDAFVDEPHLVSSLFRCCGDEDLLPFRCRGCGHLMVLCHECDTLYPDLHDLQVIEPWPAPCLSCGASTAGAHEVTHRCQRYAWANAGLDHLLRIDPR